MTQSNNQGECCEKCFDAIKNSDSIRCTNIECSCHQQQSTEEWENELLKQTEKSWGMILTESKEKLMLADFERRKTFISNLLQKERAATLEWVRGVVEGKRVTVRQYKLPTSVGAHAERYSDTDIAHNAALNDISKP